VYRIGRVPPRSATVGSAVVKGDSGMEGMFEEGGSDELFGCRMSGTGTGGGGYGMEEAGSGGDGDTGTSRTAVGEIVLAERCLYEYRW